MPDELKTTAYHAFRIVLRGTVNVDTAKDKEAAERALRHALRYVVVHSTATGDGSVEMARLTYEIEYAGPKL